MENKTINLGNEMDDLLHDIRAFYMTEGFNTEEATQKTVFDVNKKISKILLEDLNTENTNLNKEFLKLLDKDGLMLKLDDSVKKSIGYIVVDKITGKEVDLSKYN